MLSLVTYNIDGYLLFIIDDYYLLKNLINPSVSNTTI